jgi:putative tryptophan/tyrosine transport system substrate-binding protein
MLDIRRRQFITLLGSAAAAWPLASRAQPSGTMPRVGVLAANSENEVEAQARNAAFRESLDKLGWTDGRNIRIDYRWGAASERALMYAEELIDLRPSAILASNSSCADALRKKTRVIPVVFVNASDPLASGLVDSMTRPGGNLTGFANFVFSMGGKWLELLKEAAPGVARMLVIMPPANIGSQGLLRAIDSVAPTIGVQTMSAPVIKAAEIERAVVAFAQEPRSGLIVLPGFLSTDNRELIIGLANRHRLPAIYADRSVIASGGLMSYDTDVVDLYRRAASYMDRILRGVKPSELPVQLPTKYDLAINVKTAKAIGLEVSPMLLARADEVIE